MQPMNETKPAVGVPHMPWEHAGLKLLSWAGFATAGLAVLPALFNGANGMSGLASASAISFCGSGLPSGWAGDVAGMLGEVPLIASSLATGGIAAVGISVGIAVGGMWLSNYVDKHTTEGAFRWGSVIRWASLATSVLVALPMILPAISMGTMFLGTLWGVPSLQAAASTIGSLGNTGAMAGVSSAMGATGLALAHAVTCALPLGLSGFILGSEGNEAQKPMPKLNLPPLHAGRVTPLAPRALATA